MKKHIFAFLALFALLFVTACSDSEHTTSKSFDDDSDIAEKSFNSSASISDRLDIVYSDTIPLGDTVNIYIAFPTEDSTKVSSKEGEAGDSIQVTTGCQEGVICLDSGATDLALYLGELPAGTRFHVAVATSDIGNDTLYIMNEKNEALRALSPVWNNEKNDSIFVNYLVPGKGANLEKNEFVTLDSNFFYVNLKGDFKNNSHVRIYVQVDSAYYRYTGNGDTISMDKNETLHGIVLIEKAPKAVDISFSTTTGYNISISAKGQWINKFSLLDEKGKILDSTDLQKDTIGQLLFPEDTSYWSLSVEPLTIENYLSGPFATFEAVTLSRLLDKGEYIENADSIALIGDTLTVIRECKEEAKCYLRQEQFVWLGDFKKGDSVNVTHKMSGYYSDCNGTANPCPAQYSLVDKSGKNIGDINPIDNGFKATSDGAIYLRYLRLNSPARVDPPLLTLKTFVQRPGILKSMAFSSAEKTISESESIELEKMSLKFDSDKVSTQVKWLIPCDDLNFLGTTEYITMIPKCKEEGTEQEVSGTLTGLESTKGEAVLLIAESVADPKMRDTLKVFVK